MTVNEYTTQGGRTENQDFVTHRLVGHEAGIFVVADGMGGYAKGAEAARVCAEAVVDYATSHWDDDDAQLLRQAFTHANDSLFCKRIALGVRTMGCCIVAALVRHDKVSLLWLGDARAYLIRQGQATFRTTDHSLINQLSEVRPLSADDIEKYAHIVTRSMMGDDDMEPLNVETLPCSPGDVVILCSDGLHKEIDPERILAAGLPLGDTIEKAAPQLDDNASYIEVRL